MRVIKRKHQMQELAQSWQRRGLRIGFVPTMGYLHAGHLSLVARARHVVGSRGKVVLSIFVNPTQFGPGEDFEKYPRDVERDVGLCRRAGVDVVFAPSNHDLYVARPDAPFSTFVVEELLSRAMEGASRPGHFRGVTTVVAKLLHIVQPQVAVFGAKDYQQAAVVKRMVRDLDFPVEIVVAPTLREADGLAMSSRNKYLHGQLRQEATVVWRSIREVQAALRTRPRGLPAWRLRHRVHQLIRRTPSARLDYVQFFDAQTLTPIKTVKRGTHVALAVFIGKTRLIDNARL